MDPDAGGSSPENTGGSSVQSGEGGIAEPGDGVGGASSGGLASSGTGGNSATGTGGERGIGTDYYCDPENGLPTNPGTVESPWRTLEEVFSDGKSFSEGDIIHLRDGNHGSPEVNGAIASGAATVRPDGGHVPVLKSLRFSSGAAGWVVDGLLISPQEADGSLTTTTLVRFDTGATDNVLQNSQIRFAPDGIAGTWDNTAWVQSSGFAVEVLGANNQIIGNQIRNAQVGISLNRTSQAGAGATGSLVRGNSVDHFWEDAYRCRVGDTTFEYNTATNSYAVVPPGDESDPPHRDMLQAFRGDGSFTPVSNVVIRGNVFIARKGQRYTKVPFQYDGNYTIQGLGAFDGPYDNWLIENNVIMVEVGLAMGLLGISNSKIVNNTVIPDPFGSNSEIRITDQKDGTPSNNNTVRNNLVRTLNIGDATNSQASNNIEVAPANYPNYFVDYAGSDVHLKAGSPAIDKGTATDAPTIDADQAARVAPFDIGAYEFAQ